jgi:hypothetical protein
MMPRKVGLLTALVYENASAKLHDLFSWARRLYRAAHGAWQVEVICYGAAASRQLVEDGLSLRILPAVKPTLSFEAVSWSLPEALADVDVVHVHDLETRSGETGLLAAKLLGKPVCVTEPGNTHSSLGKDLQIQELADRVLAGGQLEDFHTLVTIYHGLLAQTKGIAA